MALGFVAADVEQRQLGRVLARDALEMLDPLELAVERPGILEGVPIHELDRPQRPRGAAAQPDLAVGTPTDALHQLVVRHPWRLGIHGAVSEPEDATTPAACRAGLRKQLALKSKKVGR